jgi:hypothetical protein
VWCVDGRTWDRTTLQIGSFPEARTEASAPSHELRESVSKTVGGGEDRATPSLQLQSESSVLEWALCGMAEETSLLQPVAWCRMSVLVLLI